MTNSIYCSDNRNDPSNLRNDRLDDYGKYAQPQKNTYGNTEVKYDSREPALSSSRSSIQHSKRESRGDQKSSVVYDNTLITFDFIRFRAWRDFESRINGIP